ncbi:MAG: 3'-5' exonuclease [Phocaeicola sp.]
MKKKIISNKVSKKLLPTLPKALFPGRIFVIYTVAEADKAIAYLNEQQVVGVDTETRPSFKKGTSHTVSLVQISTIDTCFLFRLNVIGMPESLQQFLMNDVLKIGLSLKDDFASLRKRESVRPDKGNWIELQDYVVRFGIEDKSLQKIYANLFGMKISKTLRLTNWEASELTEGQQRYAATDAWACIQIYEYLQELEKSGNYTLCKEEINKEISTDEL